jgi:hypothetical protein
MMTSDDGGCEIAELDVADMCSVDPIKLWLARADDLVNNAGILREAAAGKASRTWQGAAI